MLKQLRWAVCLSILTFGVTGFSTAQDQSAQYYQAGNTFYTQKNYDQAIRYYRYSAQLNPNLWRAYQGLGNCYYAKDDKATALTNYQKALAINPNNPQLSAFAQSLQAQVGSLPALPANPVGAATLTSTPTVETAGNGNSIELDVLAGGDLILSAANPVPSTYTSGSGYSLSGGYGVGFGGGADIYFPIDKKFSIGADTAFHAYGASYSTSSSGVTYGYNYTETVTESVNQSNIEVLAAAKYKFDGKNIKPYILGGAGFALVSYSGAVSAVVSIAGSTGGGGAPILSGSVFCPMAQVGGGAEFPVGNGMNFFAEGKLGIILVGSTNQTVNNSTYNVSGQYQTTSTTLLQFPIDVGLNFNL